MPRAPRVQHALRSVLDDEDRHDWSVDELRERLADAGLSADYSTVFRAVGRLAESGVVDRVVLPDGRAHYELRRTHHDHISCDRCGAVVPIPCVIVGEVLERIADETGYTVHHHDLVVAGVCPACREDSRRATPPTG